MCKRTSSKIRKCHSHALRHHELRWQLRAERPSGLTIALLPPPSGTGPAVDKQAQARIILQLVLKTIALMEKNSLIQKKIIDLRKETSDFVASVMSNPENKKRYLEHISLQKIK